MSTLKVGAIRGVSASSDAITVANNGTCTANVTNNLSNRNKIINGSMIVSQRNYTSAVTTTNAYNIDRWQNAFSGTIGAYSFSQVTDSPDGFANSFKIDVTTADTSLGSTDVHYFRTALEGQDVQDFAKGTSSAKKFTLSFYVKTTKTGTYIVNLTDSDNGRECSASYTVSDTNWNRYTVSFPADTTGAFDNDVNVSLRVLFALSGGSSFQSGTLSTTWAAQNDANRLVGQLNLADNTSNEWLITGIQLEVDHTGSGVATDFEHRSFAQELILCQRYFCKSFNYDVILADLTSGNDKFDGAISQRSIGHVQSSNILFSPYPVLMRNQPTVTLHGLTNATKASGTIRGSGNTAITALGFQNTNSDRQLCFNFTAPAAGSFISAHYLADAEL